jgi:hypothetical protein
MLIPIQVGGKNIRKQHRICLGIFLVVNSNSVPVLIYVPRRENIGVANLILIPDGDEWQVSRSDRFIPKGTALCIRWIRGWVGSQTQSGRCEEEKNLLK